MPTPIKTSSLSLKEQQLIRSLIHKGYCVISRKHGHIARIDRPDWRECMAAIHSPWDPEGEGMQWASSSGMEDHYRRCHSKDVKTFPSDYMRYFPSSGGNKVGYVSGLCPYCGGVGCDCGEDLD